MWKSALADATGICRSWIQNFESKTGAKSPIGHRTTGEAARALRLSHWHSGQPNQGYSYKDLLLFDALTESLRIELVEQPVKVSDMQLLGGLPADMRDQIAADESLLQLPSALQLLTPERTCGIFNIKLMKCGGIQAAQDADAAIRWNRPDVGL